MPDLSPTPAFVPYNELSDLYDTLLAEASFYEFFKQSWPHMEGPEVPYEDNWHIKALCDHLQACHDEKIRNLILNLSPRCGKSSIFVAFAAWVWLSKPYKKFYFASHSLGLGKKHSEGCGNLIKSDWYQIRWGTRFKLVTDTKELLINDQKGYRAITSPTSRITGQGADYLIADDLNDMQEVKSDVKRASTNEWFKTAFASRINNPKSYVMIIQQQRGHQQDIAGYLLSHDSVGKYVRFIIPMRFEERRRCTTVDIDGSGNIWTDPRAEEGALMWPARYSEKALEEKEEEIGVSNFASQFQQRPSPAEGGIIKKHWFSWWKDKTPPEIEYVIQSWDTAFSESKTASFSCCTSWGVWYDRNDIGNVIFLSMWRGRVGYPELRSMAKRLYFDYRDKGKERNPNLTGRKVDAVLIEQKATGDPLIRDLRDAGIYASPYNPSRQGDKLERVHKVTQYLEAGLVWMPAQAPEFDTLIKDADIFVEDVACFPNADSRDLVDTMTQMLRRLADLKIIAHPKDPRPLIPYDDKTPIIY